MLLSGVFGGGTVMYFGGTTHKNITLTIKHIVKYVDTCALGIHGNNTNAKP